MVFIGVIFWKLGKTWFGLLLVGEMGHNGVRKRQKCLDKITGGGGSVMNTERFIDPNLKLVNNHHNGVTLLWPMLIWNVCFKCSLDACTPFSKWMEDFFSTQQYCYLPASDLSEKMNAWCVFHCENPEATLLFLSKMRQASHGMKTSHYERRMSLPKSFH